ncbi:ComEC/Rec2 family competence protein [Paraclostridium ghonii]|uniref:Beta-lactamase superfamily II metal-dependent hydrolase n=1 Tax=Paraclostridium ghonii TaxID=29358 RepID=A0ABU0MX78_9FIRM|nr:ComEC/Rec2 family competence protein [Paeniclostridium ghonii]MDQ0555513.1 beta-lactamase superfamily II metal-dependent hydrolase [Paeniclostridium ghonii]
MKFKQKILSVALAIGLITGNTCVSLAYTQQLEVHHINVGQGESIYIEFPDGTDALIDAGKSNSGDTVVNYLKSQESDIDLEYLIATHPDADHIGGMKSVFEDLNVKNFIYPKDTQNNSITWQAVLSLANKEGCTINDSTPGSTFDIGSVTMKFIQSPKDFTDNNDDSVVTYLDYKNTKFLFTGDIEAEAENDMVNRGLVPDVDFMSVPHHGSRGSSTQEFLNKAKPECAVISVGKNSYGHPTQDALNRYANIGTKLYRTDIDGSVVIKTDGISNTINKSNVSL